jgi:hypothetical protein
MDQPADEKPPQTHPVAFKGDLRIEILENTRFLPYGLRTHRLIFTVGGDGVVRLYTASIDQSIAYGPNADLVDFLLSGINTSRVVFLKRFSVVVE